eukprot:400548-Prorocentrum_minimum.AAC.9
MQGELVISTGNEAANTIHNDQTTRENRGLPHRVDTHMRNAVSRRAGEGLCKLCVLRTGREELKLARNAVCETDVLVKWWHPVLCCTGSLTRFTGINLDPEEVCAANIVSGRSQPP